MKDILKIKGYELLSQKVYQAIKKEIVYGMLEPGTKLSENNLAKDMQVSRTPIREAIRKLTAEGLVETSPNKKMTVSEFSLIDMKEVLQVRGALEGLAAGTTAIKINKEKIDNLKKKVEKMIQCLAKKNLPTYCELDDQFHDIILNVCGNKWIIKMRNNLSNFIYRYRYKSLSFPGRLNQSLEEHQAIMEALKDHNPEKAEQLSKLHMENTIINILKNVAE